MLIDFEVRVCGLLFYLTFHSAQTMINIRYTHLKYILQWGPPNHLPHVYLGRGANVFNDCKFRNCYITSNKKLFHSVRDFDAIIFDTRDIHEMIRVNFPTRRSVKQKYILTATESAHSMPLCKRYLDNYFNWTWTYKLSSDLPRTFFTIYSLHGVAIGPKLNMQWMKSTLPLTEDMRKTLLFKTNAAAWFVDECKTFSKREIVAYEIEVELNKLGWNVDIFGRCGNKLCSPYGEECAEMLKRDYYFYLAFENSVATDYVTEVVTMAMNNYVVPVVYGGANYSNFLPPGSYLDATVLGPAAIARRMVELISNPELYQDYFRWRNHYNIVENTHVTNVCGLCELMNDQVMVNDHSYYSNIRRFFNEKSKRCY